DVSRGPAAGPGRRPTGQAPRPGFVRPISRLAALVRSQVGRRFAGTCRARPLVRLDKAKEMAAQWISTARRSPKRTTGRQEEPPSRLARSLSAIGYER